MKKQLVHIESIMVGDTIIDIEGKERTVSKSNLSRNNFTGRTINGDPYLWQNRMVEKVIYPIWNKGVIVNY